jgi:hypothetical protein
MELHTLYNINIMAKLKTVCICRKTEEKEMHTKYCPEIPLTNNHLQDIGMNEMIMLKWILEKHSVRVGNGSEKSPVAL